MVQFRQVITKNQILMSIKVTYLPFLCQEVTYDNLERQS